MPEITDEMIERAAASIADNFGYALNDREEVFDRDYWRAVARAALTAALHWELSSETNEGENR